MKFIFELIEYIDYYIYFDVVRIFVMKGRSKSKHKSNEEETEASINYTFQIKRCLPLLLGDELNNHLKYVYGLRLKFSLLKVFIIKLNLNSYHTFTIVSNKYI